MEEEGADMGLWQVKKGAIAWLLVSLCVLLNQLGRLASIVALQFFTQRKVNFARIPNEKQILA